MVVTAADPEVAQIYGLYQGTPYSMYIHIFIISQLTAKMNAEFVSKGDYKNHQKYGINTNECGLRYEPILVNISFPTKCFQTNHSMIQILDEEVYYFMNEPDITSSRVADGEVAVVSGKPLQAPWAVSIQLRVHGMDADLCSGVLIAMNWVLTSGHCIDVRLWYGHWAIRASPFLGVGFQTRYVNQSFKASGGLDVGLFQTDRPFTRLRDRTLKRHYSINTVCLPETNRTFISGNMTVFGFGYTANDKSFSPYLHKAELGLWLQDSVTGLRCDFTYGGPKTLCAESIKGRICMGDSGAGWVRYNNRLRTQAIVLGVSQVIHIGSGDVCAKRRAFAASISYAMPWILSTIQNNPDRNVDKIVDPTQPEPELTRPEPDPNPRSKFQTQPNPNPKPKKYYNSFDRFGDDLCQLLLSFLPLKERFRYEFISRQWHRLVFTTQSDLIIDDNLCDTANDNKILSDDLSRMKILFGLKLTFTTNSEAILSQLLSRIGRKCPQLKSLEILFNESTIDNVLQTIGTSFKRLKRLQLTFDSNVSLNTSAESLKTLKRLTHFVSNHLMVNHVKITSVALEALLRLKYLRTGHLIGDIYRIPGTVHLLNKFPVAICIFIKHQNNQIVGNVQQIRPKFSIRSAFMSDGKDLTMDEIHKNYVKYFVKIHQLGGMLADGDYMHSWGSGVCLGGTGYILTNCHVVGEWGIKLVERFHVDNNGDIRVVPGIGEMITGAKVMYCCPQFDIAIVHSKCTETDDISLQELTVSARDGQQVLSIGNPVGLDFCLSDGVVSCVGREGRTLCTDTYEYHMIYADANGFHLNHTSPIFGGFSGGPVINMSGQLVGINYGSVTIGEGELRDTFGISTANIVDILKEMNQFSEKRRTYSADKSLGLAVRLLTRDLWAKIYGPNTKSLLVTRSVHMSDGKDLTIDEIYRQYAKYFVKIHNTDTDKPNGYYIFSWGSGVCLGGSGYILTNCHVVGESEFCYIEQFKVDNNGDVGVVPVVEEEITVAKVMYCDPRFDIAVVHSKCAETADIKLQELAFSTQDGQHVVCIGNPSPNYCLCDGVVSCVGREGRTLCVDNYEYFKLFTDPKGVHICDTCPVFGGFSGGPLINMSGQLVGINYGGVGFGTFRENFAINTSNITEVLNNMKVFSEKKYTYSAEKSLGLAVIPFTRDLWANNEINEFDLIVGVNGRLINSVNELRDYCHNCNPYYLIVNEIISALMSQNKDLTIDEIYKQYVNCFVEVHNANGHKPNGEFMYSWGSGVTLGLGYILTNCHVVGESEFVYVERFNADKTGQVQGLGIEEDIKARVIYSCPELDIAVVYSDCNKSDDIRPLELAFNARDGQHVVTLGNLPPEYCLCDGVVSSACREGHTLCVGTYEYYQVWPDPTGLRISNTCTIFPGFSGGPLINMSGQLVGINYGAVGYGTYRENFAINTSNITEVLNDMKLFSEKRHTYSVEKSLRLAVRPLTKELKHQNNQIVANVQQIRPKFTIRSADMSDGKDLTIDEIYKKYINYFVKIHNTTDDEPNGDFMYSWGSGVALGGTGYILTNCHVAGDEGINFVERFKVDDNGDVRGLGIAQDITAARIMYCCPQLDIAVVHSLCTETHDIRVPELAFSARDGQYVVSLGNPSLDGCLFDGVVSSAGREGRTLCVGTYEYHQVWPDPSGLHIIHACPQYGGFSGGPLINMSGQLVGINYGGSGFGMFRDNFAIGAADITDVLNEMKLFLEKKYTYSAEKSLGLAVEPMTRDLWANTDIRSGDIIVRVNDNPINSVKQLRDYCNNCNPNEVLDIMFGESVHMSDGKDLTIDEIYRKYINYFVKIMHVTSKYPNGKYMVSWGSGVCLGGTGYIVTNCHVVGEAGHWFVNRFKVDNNGDVCGLGVKDPITGAQVMYCSPQLDIAVIHSKCTVTADTEVQDVGFSISDGQHVVSIGNPTLPFCLSDGVVSCTGREGRTLCVDNYEYHMVYTDPTGLHITHTCSTYNGFSGGPLINMSGQLVGIHYGSIGRGTFREAFSINTASVWGVLNDMKLFSEKRHTYSAEKSLGLALRPMTIELWETLFGSDSECTINEGLLVLRKLTTNSVSIPSALMSQNKDLTIDEIYEKYVNYFVKIHNTTGKRPNGQFAWGWGSGVCLGGSGYILTNCHVVGDWGLWFTERFQVDNEGHVRGLGINDGITFSRVMYCSPRLDIAIVYSKCTEKDDIGLQELGFSTNAGQHVVSIGNPMLEFCLIDGVVNCVGREGRTLCVDTHEYFMVFTDPTGLHLNHSCPIVQGFSGGPVLNMSGQLVGINYGSIGHGTFRDTFGINTADITG
ncbi:unnamed protein product [Medioppia subpectinata]|uniref:Peptidase S1 domain-containing protein n=1 Tax=Medioppia subpectinata TaxID=1979941 RepID=A0A7R9KE14_9ACAR|nr:unnamed protein product [Medioppia subpectinata]CAG2100563.1 unnamed protein product [Medioppia subpectinata]